MKIGIVGYGTVGSAMARLLTRGTHTVEIFDPFLAAYSSASQRAAINGCELVFVCVPTPEVPESGACDVSIVEECVRWIEAPVCIRSTVVPGTCERLTRMTGRPIAFSPEYLGESGAHPWREADSCGFAIVGGPAIVCDLVIAAYESCTSPPVKRYRTTARTAELCKYMENCFLATKVTFVNQFHEIAEALDVDFEELRELWLLDSRIGASHTSVTPERGFGGRCLPKDLSGLITLMRGLGGAPFLEAIREYNRRIRGEEVEAEAWSAAGKARTAIARDEGLKSIWDQASANDGDGDDAHDSAHLLRVAEWALRLNNEEMPEPEVVAAALLHDLVNLPKNSEQRRHASQLSAEASRPILAEAGFDTAAIMRIAGAIRDHSFSRGATPEDALGRALQDADRLDAVGAIGIVRAIASGVRMGGAFMHPEDPWAEHRPLDDKSYSLDHFFTKLLNLPDTLTTEAGRIEAARRVGFMRSFLHQLARETERPMPEREGTGGASG